MNKIQLTGWILIDRCGKHFGAILNFLRDGSVALPESSRGISELHAEAKYYCILDLADFCDRALQNKQKEPEPICRVPLITSQKEEQLLISSSQKVHYIELSLYPVRIGPFEMKLICGFCSRWSSCSLTGTTTSIPIRTHLTIIC